LTTIAPDAEAAVFSAKSFTAAMIAYYVSLKIGFSAPVWAITTAYLVSQPLAGAVLSKALFRLLGTLLGGVAAVIFLPAFINEPLVLSLVLAFWLGLCVYVALLDRTPRSYVFLLAGYTASVIGFPSVLAPGGIFNTAILRVQEIGIGVVAASLVHGAIWPRTITSRLQKRINAIVGDAEQWSRRALAGSRGLVLDRERRRLASDTAEIEQLAFHLAFDPERLVPPSRVIRALQDQLCWLLPLSGVVEDRIAECAERSDGLPPEVIDLIGHVGAWLDGSKSGGAQDEAARDLVDDAQKLEGAIAAKERPGWLEMLLVSLLARLAELVITHRVLRELRDHVSDSGMRSLSPQATTLLAATAGRSMHRDHGLALRSALGSTVGVYAVCVFWIFTAWPSGATAALIAAISCSLFSANPAPGVAVRRFFEGSLAGIAIAALYGFAIFPRVTDFIMLVLVVAPILLLIGSMLARPPLTLLALGGVVGFVNTVGLSATYQTDFSGFINGAIAQIAGSGVSVIFVGMFQVVSTDAALARLFRAGFRDIAARADGDAPNTQRWTSRMIDRAALIAARVGAPSPEEPGRMHYDALVGLWIGYIAGELHALLPTVAASEARTPLAEVLRSVSAHFRRIEPARHVPTGEPVLRAIDQAMKAFAADPRTDRRRAGLVLLTGLRRSLFPNADPFAGTRA
jgi:uncharacterized membrane protein YccC